MQKLVLSKFRSGRESEGNYIPENLIKSWLNFSAGRHKGLWLLLFCLLPFFGLQAQTTYTWVGGGANTDWGTVANWNPTRTTPAPTDIIQFSSNATVTSIPSETIGQLLINNNATVALSST